MVFKTSFIRGNWGEKPYKLRATGKIAPFRERRRTQVSCTKCGVTVAALYLKQHMAWIHGIYSPHTRRVDEGGGGLTTYMVSFSRVLKLVKRPVPGCPDLEHSAGRLHEHFIYRHFKSHVAVV